MKTYVDVKERVLTELAPVQNAVKQSLDGRCTIFVNIAGAEGYKLETKHSRTYMARRDSKITVELRLKFKGEIYLVGLYDLFEDRFTTKTILKEMIDWAKIKAKCYPLIREQAVQFADDLENFYNNI